MFKKLVVVGFSYAKYKGRVKCEVMVPELVELGNPITDWVTCSPHSGRPK